MKKNRQPRSAGKAQPLAYVRNVVAPTDNIQQESLYVNKNQTQDTLFGFWFKLKGGSRDVHNQGRDARQEKLADNGCTTFRFWKVVQLN